MSCHGLITGYGFTIIHFLVFQLLVVVEVVTSAVLYRWYDAQGFTCARPLQLRSGGELKSE